MARRVTISTSSEADFATAANGGVVVAYDDDGKLTDSGIAIGNAGYNDGYLGFGAASTPAQLMHFADGNLYGEGGGEISFLVKRSGYSENSGVEGQCTNPIFYMMRLSQAGDGSIENKRMASSDEYTERSTLKSDFKGITGFIRSIDIQSGIGSMSEGFTEDDVYPHYRMNSYPRIGLEMGEGGATNDYDVRVERSGASELALMAGDGTAGSTVTNIMLLDEDGAHIQDNLELRLFEDSGNGSNYFSLKAPASMSANYTRTMYPSVDNMVADAFEGTASSSLVQIEANTWAKAYYFSGAITKGAWTTLDSLSTNYVPFEIEGTWPEGSGIMTAGGAYWSVRNNSGTVEYYNSTGGTPETGGSVLVVKYYLIVT